MACAWALGGLASAAFAQTDMGPDISKAVMPIAEQLDPATAPCDDFYKYVCTKWQAANPLPDDRARWGAFNTLAEANIRKLRAILDDAIAHPTKETAKLADFYTACMDESGIEAAGLVPILKALSLIDGLSGKSGLAALLSDPAMRGVPAFFGFGSQIDPKESTRNIATLSQGGLGLPDRDYYTRMDDRSVKLREAYLAHITNQFANAGDTPETASQRAHAVLNFETELAKISLERVRQRDPNVTYNITPVADLVTMMPGFDWPGYFKALDAPDFDRLNIRTLDYIKALSGVIDKAALSDVKAYLAWGLIRSSAANLPKRFEDESFAFFSKTLGGAKAPLPRWQRCVNATDNALGESLGRIFVDRYFPPKAKMATSDLINQVRASFKGRIADLTWMSAETKAKAVQKLAAIDENIGYPAKFRDLSGLLIRRDEALGNVRRAALFERQRNLAKIGRPVERGEWRMTTPTVNAFYSPPLNDINFPAGILQPPFFDPDLDPAINYGAIGAVIGHEITHGFDDQGSKYDAQGNLVDWWTPDDRKQFDTRTQCLVDQYGGYTADGEVKVNGKLTLGENTADNGGARIAYIGLKRFLAAHGAYAKPIDGLSAEQRFFVGFARLWCSNDRPEGRRLRAQTDPHSPSDFRVNGTVSNMPEFAQAFQCKPGDKMVRPDACQVW